MVRGRLIAAGGGSIDNGDNNVFLLLLCLDDLCLIGGSNETVNVSE